MIRRLVGSRLRVFLAAVPYILLLLMVPRAEAQGSAFSGQVIQPAPPTGTGGPAPFALVRVCAITATGSPCSPTANIYADPALTAPLSNPYTTDDEGNYSIFVAPGYYLVQIQAITNVVYSYLISSNGNASVSSIGLSMPNIFNVTPSTITTFGVFNVTLASQSANNVFAAPDGAPGLPAFRPLVTGDIPWGTPGWLGQTVPNRVSATTILAQNLDFATVYAAAYSNVQAAIAACPASQGCVVDARDPNVNLALGAIDPGSKVIFLLLGPYTYTFTQITLENGFKMYGATDFGLGVITILHSVGNDATAAFVLGATQPITGVVLQDVRITGADTTSSGTQPGMQLVAITNGGIWKSQLNRVYMSNFGGRVIDFDGSASSTSLNQFNTFNDVYINRNTYDGTHPNEALRLLGANGQFTCNNCILDGQPNTEDGWENLRIEASNVTGFITPYSITFNQMTNEFSSVGVHIIGCVGCAFNNPHHEDQFGSYLLDFNGGVGVGSQGVIIQGGRFQNNIGINGGNGYIAKVTPAAASQYTLDFENNGLYNNPDHVVVGQAGIYSTIHNTYSLVGAGLSLFNQNITPTIAPATSITTGSMTMINLSSSATPIENVVSSLSQGDTLTFQVASGTATFDNTGNLNLGGYQTFTLNAGEGITFAASSVTNTLVMVGYGKSTLPYLVINGAAPNAPAGAVAYGGTTGFGNGTASTAVTTTTLGTGTGPTNPQVITGYIEEKCGTTLCWVPTMQ